MGDKVGSRTWFAVAFTLIVWASAFPGIKVGLAAYSPGQVALLRFGTASIVLALFALVTRMRLPALADLPRIAIAGFLGITVYHVALNYGEVSVSAGAASLLIAAGPLFTALLAIAFLGERLNVWGWTGSAVAFIGVTVITLAENGTFQFEPRALVVLLAAVSTGAYFILSKRPLRKYSGLEFTSYAIWCGTVPMLVFAPGLLQRLPQAPASSTLAVVYLGVFPGAVAYVMWSYALARMPASRLSSWLYLQPLNASLIAWFWIRELPTWGTVIGGIVVLGGVIMVNSFGKPKEVVAAEDETQQVPGAPPVE